jgi:iron complex transport system substrate-binding protein
MFLEPPTRIVSLVPSATLTLQALGAQSFLVGRTEYDTGRALAHLPSVGGGLEPSLEALVVLEPDLVIRFAGDSDPSTPRRLDDMGIRHLAVRLDRVADVRALLRELGAVTGLRDRAAELVAEMDATLGEIRQRVQGRPRVRVAYILGGNPPWVAGPGTFIDELLTTAGGENSFSDLQALYGPVSPEEFLVREIDLLLAPEGEEVLLPATSIPLMRVSPALELPGPNLAQSAWHLAELLHPEVFR